MMRIIAKNLPVKYSQEGVLEIFEKYGECSIEFKVRPNQADYFIVEYKSSSIANEALLNLNGKAIDGCPINLELLYNSSLLIPPSPIHLQNSVEFESSSEQSKGSLRKRISFKYANSDIEIQIPVNEVSFLNQNSHQDITPPGSYSSPFFPDAHNQSSLSSPRSQITFLDINNNLDSPISVNTIPPIGVERLGEISGSPEKIKVKKHKKRNVEANNIEILCEVCQKNIKKKSYKAHLNTKVHLNNLKVNS